MAGTRNLCQGRAWVQITTPYRLQCQALNEPCALCHKPIDYTLHRNHRHAFTVDHITALWAGGAPHDPTNWQPSHRSCNSSRGAREGNRLRNPPRPQPPRYQRTQHTW